MTVINNKKKRSSTDKFIRKELMSSSSNSIVFYFGHLFIPPFRSNSFYFVIVIKFQGQNKLKDIYQVFKLNNFHQLYIITMNFKKPLVRFV